MPLRIALLGPPQVEVDGRPLVVDTRKATAILAYLAVVDRPIARDSLVELLWPEADPEGGRGALRRTLSTLRAALQGSWLRVDRKQVALARDDVEVDVARFRAAARGEDRRALTAAAATFRGDFLEGFGLRDSAAWDEWQALEREALRGELAAVLRQLAMVDLDEGRGDAALTSARRLLALDPLDEGGHRLVMRILASGGDRAGVARQYRACADLLAAELDVQPDAETTALYRSLLETDAGNPAEQPAVINRAAVTTATAPLSVDREARTLLEASAVIGESADPDIARLVAGLDEPAAAVAFERLVAAGALEEPPIGQADERYRFPSAAHRAAALTGVGLARRRMLGRAAAAALADAAGEARRRSDHAGAADHLRSALALGVPDRTAVLEALGEVEMLRGAYGEALAALEQAAALADPADVARLEHRLAALHVRRGALELAEVHLAAARSRLGEGADPLRARLLADQSLIAIRRGQVRVAHRLARASLHEARSSVDADTESQAENLLALLARRRGDLDAARRHLRRSLDRAGVADAPSARVAALNHLALLERAAGNLDDALALTDEALRRCVVLGDRHREAALRNNRADLLHALGRGSEAAEEQVRSVTAFAEVGDRRAFEPEIWKLVEW